MTVSILKYCDTLTILSYLDQTWVCSNLQGVSKFTNYFFEGCPTEFNVHSYGIKTFINSLNHGNKVLRHIVEMFALMERDHVSNSNGSIMTKCVTQH